MCLLRGKGKGLPRYGYPRHTELLALAGGPYEDVTHKDGVPAIIADTLDKYKKLVGDRNLENATRVIEGV
jgi:hypothetical protein